MEVPVGAATVAAADVELAALGLVEFGYLLSAKQVFRSSSHCLM